MGEMTNPNPNGWEEWGKYVLKALEAGDNSRAQLTKEIKELRLSLAAMQADLAVIRTELKIKAGVWGALGAAIPTIVILAVQLLG